jgi:hypothetical protein
MMGKPAMSMISSANRAFIGTVIVFLIALAPPSTTAGVAIGPRAGYDFDSDNFVLGAESELGRAFQSFRFAPSLDFELGDNTFTALNADFRLYLFHLPETGLHFYGSAGPTVLLDSPGKGDSQTEIGFSLVAGMKIPMSGQNRYNLEARFGFGDIPDLKVMFAVLFGI